MAKVIFGSESNLQMVVYYSLTSVPAVFTFVYSNGIEKGSVQKDVLG